MHWRVLVSLLAGSVSLAQASQPVPAAETPPNVLVVFTDDQRFDTIHALGNEEIRTPNLDALIGRGFHFRNAYCMGGLVPAVCAPSRTMFMTSRTLFRIPAPNAKTYEGPTLGSVFRNAGYDALFVGKKGNSFLAGNQAFEKVVYHDDREPSKRAESSRFMADQAIDWLRARGKTDRPFLMYLAPPVPHDPRIAPVEYMRMYDPDHVSLSPNFRPEHPFDNGELRIRDELLAPFPRTPAEMRRHLAEYYASITWLDHNVGRVVEALRGSGALDRTIIVFSSDQGLAVGGRHGLMGKQNLYEEFKSPLIFAGPGIPQGSSDALVYLHDILPTICEMASIPIPREFEGSSLVPVIQGRKPNVREVLFGAYRDCQRMVRDERWKLLWYPKIDRFQLFDLANDPWEIHDLSTDPGQVDRLSRMKAILGEEQHRHGDDRVARLTPR
ncbi:MAG: sulfatase-like hydrolase/transferase [Isosphaeraceae bacterium]